MGAADGLRPDQRAQRIGFRDASGRLRSATFAQVGLLPLDSWQPVRDPHFYKGMRNRPGWYLTRTTGTFVSYRTRTALDVLMCLDFDPNVVGLLAEPFCFWPDGGEALRVPHLMMRLREGRRRVVDVVAERASASARVECAFEQTERVCRELGFDYSVEEARDEQLMTNLRLLASCRTRPWRLDEYEQRVLEACRRALPFDELFGRVGEPAAVKPVVFHLLWHHRLRVRDLTKPLTMETVVQAAEVSRASA